MIVTRGEGPLVGLFRESPALHAGSLGVEARSVRPVDRVVD